MIEILDGAVPIRLIYLSGLILLKCFALELYLSAVYLPCALCSNY